MYHFYFDASALVKRYTDEKGSYEIDFFFDNIPLSRICCLNIGAIEVFWVCVRKKNDGRITRHQFARAVTHLKSEVMNPYSDFKTIPIPDSLILNSMALIDTHSLNSVDALVLQSALDIDTELNNNGERLVLVASDRRLLRAANTEGLLVCHSTHYLKVGACAS